MTLPVALWIAQSLLGAAAVMGWLSATVRAGRLGATGLTRWLFPWLALWRSGRVARIALEALVIVAYGVCAWLARGD
ncbi:MAG: hypothetical protein R3A48_05265 [Polyangiales bacterium]